jgi:hypothetical protein
MLCLIAALGASDALAQYGPKPEKIIGPGLNSGRTEYYQNWNRVLSADTVYVLTGLYYVDSTYTMTIRPGTVIKADTAASLVVTRGAKIFARGTNVAPIVFTSLKAPGSRARGDWGGVLILGKAPCNKVEPLIEGGIIGGTYGGNDPADNSGVFAYVRLEFGGYRYQLNNEVNGLTMGAVGRNTEIHHIQVSYNFDDAFEWFGGNVDARYLVSFADTDDQFDTDFGYSGRLQYLFGLRDPQVSDPTGESRGCESDNDGNSLSTATPFTSAVASNATWVGPGRTDATIPTIPLTATFDWSSVQRRSSQFSYINSAIIGYPKAVRIQNDSTHAFACQGKLQIRCASIAAFASGNDTSGWPAGAPGCNVGIANWIATPSFNNIGYVRQPDTMGLTDMSNLNDPNPVPVVGSELDTAPVCFGTGDDTNDPWFERTDYRGAFVPGLPMNQQWTAVWTEFDPQDVDYNPTNTAIGDTPAVSSNSLAQNHPNPFNPTTTIRYSVADRGHVMLRVFNAAGQLVRTLVDEEKAPVQGGYTVTWNGLSDQGRPVASGVYFYQLTTGNFSETKKMVLLK